MASGAAVVATETAGAVELIKTEETGLLVPVADVNRMVAAILLLLTDETKRRRLGQRAQEVAAINFGVDRMIDETEAVYKIELGLT
jgi:glycosyltransferase involved in cell wall biosynthesis